LSLGTKVYVPLFLGIDENVIDPSFVLIKLVVIGTAVVSP